MRTTITIDEHLLSEAKQAAARSGRTLSEVVSDALRLALRRKERETREEFHLPTYPGRGGVRPGINLDCTGALLDLLDEWDATDRR